jgi:hypothetical protein
MSSAMAGASDAAYPAPGRDSRGNSIEGTANSRTSLSCATSVSEDSSGNRVCSYSPTPDPGANFLHPDLKACWDRGVPYCQATVSTATVGTTFGTCDVQAAGHDGCVASYLMPAYKYPFALPNPVFKRSLPPAPNCHVYKTTYVNGALYGCINDAQAGTSAPLLDGASPYVDPYTGQTLGARISAHTATGASCSCAGHFSIDGFALCDQACGYPNSPIYKAALAGQGKPSPHDQISSTGTTSWRMITNSLPVVARQPARACAGYQGNNSCWSTGSHNFSASCPYNAAVAGFRDVRHGGDMDSFNLKCKGRPGRWDADESTADMGISCGDCGSDSPSWWYCPTDEYVVSIRWKYSTGNDDQIARVEMCCNDIAHTRTSPLCSGALGIHYGDDSGDDGAYAFTCPVGTVVKSASTYANNEPSWLGFTCGSPF